jgi:hypothetical protein
LRIRSFIQFSEYRSNLGSCRFRALYPKPFSTIFFCNLRRLQFYFRAKNSAKNHLRLAVWNRSSEGKKSDVLVGSVNTFIILHTKEFKINRKFRVTTEIGSTFFWLLVSYQAAEKLKYVFLSSVWNFRSIEYHHALF